MEFSRFRAATFVLEAAVCALVMLAGASSVLHAEMAAGDRAWSLRAAQVEGDRADPQNVEIAIDEYRSTLSESPQSLEARWKLLRALQYAVDFTSVSEEKQNAYVDEAVSAAQTQDEVSQNTAGTEADQARVLFWSSIAWGMRAQRVGLLTIVRQGVATRMQQDAEQSLKLDPSVDEGGALRLLSRLNATLPKVPFVSGWVDRKKVLPLAERAYQLDPEHPGNQLILALALIDRAPSRRPEAEKLLQEVADLTPRPEFYVEDLQIRQQARDSLADFKKKNR